MQKSQQTNQLTIQPESRPQTVEIPLIWLNEFIEILDKILNEHLQYYNDLIETIDKQIKEIDSLNAISYNKYLIANNKTDLLIDENKYEDKDKDRDKEIKNFHKSIEKLRWYDANYDINKAVKGIEQKCYLYIFYLFNKEILSKIGDIELYNEKIDDFILNPYKYITIKPYVFYDVNENGELKKIIINTNELAILYLFKLRNTITHSDYEIIKEYLSLTDLEKRDEIKKDSIIAQACYKIADYDIDKYIEYKATEQAENQKAIERASQPDKTATEPQKEPNIYSFGEFKDGKFNWNKKHCQLAYILNIVKKSIYPNISDGNLSKIASEKFLFKGKEINLNSFANQINEYQANQIIEIDFDLETAKELVEAILKQS